MAADVAGLKSNGFCFVQGVSETELLDYVKPLGRIRADSRNPELIREIRPQSISTAKSNTLSSRHGTGRFPFHTDTAHWERPARYLILYCVTPGSGERPTLLQDSHSWKLIRGEMDLAARALWVVGNRTAKLTYVVLASDEQLSIRYDMDCMRPMTEEARELRNILVRKVETTPQLRIDWHAGDLLVIDNHRMVHARGAAKRDDEDRVLKRILVGGD